jgi:hypothetical protein
VRAARPGRDRDRPAALNLALREIDDHLTFTDAAAWAWYVLPAQQWAFRSEHQRLNLLLDSGDAYAGLAGRRLHLRVTSRPYPAASWARGLDQRTPAPLPGVAGATWGDHLVRVQQHLRATTMAEKEVYLGVRLAGRGSVDLLLDRVLRRTANREVERVARAAESVTEVVAGPGMGGRPASATELEWLLRRSVGLGLPAPGSLCPAPGGHWDTEDLHAFTDGISYEAVPFAPTTKVHGTLADGREVTRHVAVLSVGRMPEIEIPDGSHEPWIAHTDRLPFGVEWSARLDLLSGAEAQQAIQRKLLVVRDMQRHYSDHDLDEPLALERQARHARVVEDEMTQGADVIANRVHGWYRIAVWGATEEECLERARKVVASYRNRRIAIEHPRAQFALLREFTPGEPLAATAYRRRMPALYHAAAVPTVSANLGDRRGPYIGYTCGSSRRAVMFDTHYATEIRETSGLVPVVGELGSGKSVLMGLMTYEAVRRGIPSVLLDPSGPLARLTELPELRDRSRHIDLTQAAPGTLNPFAVVAAPRRDQYGDDDAFEEAKVLAAQDRKLLALDIARMLLPPSLDVMPETRIVLSDAVRATGGAPMSSLWTVIEQLEGHNDRHGRVVANYLRDMAEMPMARLFFPTGSQPVTRLDTTLTVLTMPGLVLPPRNVAREHWSTSEQMAVPLLHLASWYASRAIYGREMQERKLVALDEIHFLGEWGAGRALFTRLGRDSRKWNTCVLAASQNPKDVLGMDVANFMAAAFVGRIEDEENAADGLRMLRVPTGVGYERVLSMLSPRGGSDGPGGPAGNGTAERQASREFVLRDVDGRVDKMRVDLAHNPALLAALDTTAKPAAPAYGPAPEEEILAVPLGLDQPRPAVAVQQTQRVAGDDEIAFV